MAVADVDGDGTPDLVTHDVRGRLAIRLRGATERPLRGVDVGVPSGLDTLRLGDLDGDGSADAIVLTREGLRIATDLAKAPKVQPARPIGGQRVRGFVIGDYDGDGHLDLAVGSDAPGRSIRVWPGRGDGSFDEALLLGRAGYRYLSVGPRATPAGSSGEAETLVAIQRPPGRLVELTLRRVEGRDRPAPSMTTLAERSAPGAWPFAHGDVDGDGDRDLVIAHPERAELIWLFETDGRFESRRQPCPSGVTSLALGDVDRDGQVDLVLASPSEELWLGAPARVDTPASRCGCRRPGDRAPCWCRLRIGRRPAATSSWNATSPGRGVCIGSRWGPIGCRPSRPSSSSWGVCRASRPSLMAADLHPNAGFELLFCSPRGGLQAMLRDRSGKWMPPAPATGFAKELEDGAVRVTRRGGRDALEVVRPRFVRRLRYDAVGQFVVEDQDNGPTVGAQLDLMTRMGEDRVYFDRDAGRLHRVRPDGGSMSVDLPGLAATHLLEHDAGTVLLIAGNGVVRVPFGRAFELATDRSTRGSDGRHRLP